MTNTYRELKRKETHKKEKKEMCFICKMEVVDPVTTEKGVCCARHPGVMEETVK